MAKHWYLWIGLMVLQGCTTQIELQPLPFEALPGWQNDNILQAAPALKKSCCQLLESHAAASWEPFCHALIQAKPLSEKRLRALIEQFLVPYQVSHNGTSTGLFTGYYEPILKGSRKRDGAYQVPLYSLPSEDLRASYSRAEIAGGALNYKGLEIVWVKDPVEAFFLEIQGSGLVKLQEGGYLRLRYAGQNGKPYFAIGKALIASGDLTVATTTLATIKQWLKKNPAAIPATLALNPSYVFFQEHMEDGPIGAQGVTLTPGRSLAVDPSYVPLGTPVWVDVSHPDTKKPPLRRLMVAQDKGGAIKGGIRGDFFWGTGTKAESYAGKMKSQGGYFLLFPK